MKEQLKELWKQTFADPDLYIHFFFEHIYKEENVLYYEKKGKLISALHMIPYQMIFESSILPVSYICGVATIPAERGKGLMHSLMTEAHTLLKERGDIFSILIPASPALFEYYKKMGYMDMFYYQSTLYEKECQIADILSIQKTNEQKIALEKLYKFFSGQLLKREIGILHTYPDFCLILHEMKLAGGKLKTIQSSTGEIRGMAFLYPHEEKNTFLIKELIYIHPEDRDILLEKIRKEFPTYTLIVREPVSKGTAIPFGMALPLNELAPPAFPGKTGFMSLMLE